jgi:sulfur-oxidizing protein SoxY
MNAHTKTRREFMQRSASLGALVLTATPVMSIAQVATSAPANVSTPDALFAAVRAYVEKAAGSATPREGRVKLDIAPLVDNGNSVPITITVESPMTASDHVVGIAVFNEKNPQRDVIEFTLTPDMGVARISTRIRLAMTQRLVAVARMSDGSVWTHTVNVLVTLAACIEDD